MELYFDAIASLAVNHQGTDVRWQDPLGHYIIAMQTPVTRRWFATRLSNFSGGYRGRRRLRYAHSNPGEKMLSILLLLINFILTPVFLGEKIEEKASSCIILVQTTRSGIRASAYYDRNRGESWDLVVLTKQYVGCA